MNDLRTQEREQVASRYIPPVGIHPWALRGHRSFRSSRCVQVRWWRTDA
jgi:hypothetical protein